MPAVIHKIDFSAAAERSGDAACLNPADCKIISFAPETAALVSYRLPHTLPHHRHPQAAITALLAVGLHAAGFILIPDPAPKEIVTPPTIQVSWLAEPQPKAPTPPAAPPKQQQPAAKPKPAPVKRAKPKPKPKAVLSTRASAATTAKSTAAPPEKTENTAKPSPAPVAPPATSAAQAAAPAAADQQPLILPNLHANYLNNPAPRYPEDARERGEQGKVLVRALINTDGTVAELALRKSSGYASLDRSALETIKKWRFVPARRGSTAVTAWVVVPITFSLKG